MRSRSSSRPSPVSAEIWSASRYRFASRRRPSVVDRVDLVHDELDGQIVRPDLAQNRVDGGHLLDELLLGGRAVDDVQDEVGDERLLERRGEALDELVRQAPDEADGVGDEIAPSLLLEAARDRGRASRTAGRATETPASVSALRSVDLPAFV